eukprot:g3106.t1
MGCDSDWEDATIHLTLDLDTTEEMPNKTFYNCDALLSVTINSNSLTKVGWQNFAYASNLETVTFEYCPSFKTLANKVFMNSSLTTLDVSNCENLNWLGNYTFLNCDNLKNMSWPSEVYMSTNAPFSGTCFDAITDRDDLRGKTFENCVEVAQCYCTNGTQASGFDCTAAGTEICASCDSGYSLVNNLCTQDACSCSNGTAAIGSDCTSPGTEICSSCNTGFYLDTNTCSEVSLSDDNETVARAVTAITTYMDTNELSFDEAMSYYENLDFFDNVAENILDGVTAAEFEAAVRLAYSNSLCDSTAMEYAAIIMENLHSDKSEEEAAYTLYTNGTMESLVTRLGLSIDAETLYNCVCDNMNLTCQSVEELVFEDTGDRRRNRRLGSWNYSASTIGSYNLSYLGCVADDSTRVMSKLIYNSSQRELKECRSDCDNSGYYYFAVQNGTECWCADDLDGYRGNDCDDQSKGCVRDDDFCNDHWTNNGNDKLGEAWRLVLFTVREPKCSAYKDAKGKSCANGTQYNADSRCASTPNNYSATICSDNDFGAGDTCCTHIDCPSNSSGNNVYSGCTCDDGYSGTITATSGGYSGSCTEVSCPSNSTGSGVASGCTCNAGFNGTIIATSGGYSGSCTEVSCPSNSSGSDVASGCTCNAGFSGTITASTSSPYYTGSCSAVQCPSNSSGNSVSEGCKCDSGYTGSVTATSSSPFYTNTCSNVMCPTNSTGQNVASGCTCNAGYAGTIAASSVSPFYTGSCVAQACPVNSSGANLASGCTCNAGFSGTITPVIGSPYYSGSCGTGVQCPSNSSGNSVPDGCTCNSGYVGSIVASSTSPYYTGQCVLGSSCSHIIDAGLANTTSSCPSPDYYFSGLTSACNSDVCDVSVDFAAGTGSCCKPITCNGLNDFGTGTCPTGYKSRVSNECMDCYYSYGLCVGSDSSRRDRKLSNLRRKLSDTCLTEYASCVESSNCDLSEAFSSDGNCCELNHEEYYTSFSYSSALDDSSSSCSAYQEYGEFSINLPVDSEISEVSVLMDSSSSSVNAFLSYSSIGGTTTYYGLSSTVEEATVTFTPTALPAEVASLRSSIMAERSAEICGTAAPLVSFDPKAMQYYSAVADSAPCECFNLCTNDAQCLAWLFDRTPSSSTYRTCYLSDLSSSASEVLDAADAMHYIGDTKGSSVASDLGVALNMSASSKNGSSMMEVAEMAFINVYLPPFSQSVIQEHLETHYNQLILGSEASLPTVTVKTGFAVEHVGTSSSAKWAVSDDIVWTHSDTNYDTTLVQQQIAQYGLHELTYGVMEHYVTSDELINDCMDVVSEDAHGTHWVFDPAVTEAYDGDVQRSADSYGVEIESLAICRRVSQNEYSLHEMDESDICGLASINDENATCQPTDLHANFSGDAVYFVWKPGCRDTHSYQLIKNRTVQIGADYEKNAGTVSDVTATDEEIKEELCETEVSPGLSLYDVDTTWNVGDDVEYCIRGLILQNGEEIASNWTCTKTNIGWLSEAVVHVSSKSGNTPLSGVLVDTITCATDDTDCQSRAVNAFSGNDASGNWRHSLSDGGTMLSFTAYAHSETLVPIDEDNEDRTGACKYGEGDAIDVTTDVPAFRLDLDADTFSTSGIEASLVWYADAPGCFLQVEKGSADTSATVTSTGGLQVDVLSSFGFGYHFQVQREPSWMYMAVNCRSTCGLTGKDIGGVENNFALPYVLDKQPRSFCEKYLDRCPDVSESLGDVDPEELGAMILGADIDSNDTVVCSPFANEYAYYDEDLEEYACCAGYRPTFWDSCNRHFTMCDSSQNAVDATSLSQPSRKFRVSLQTAHSFYDEDQMNTSAPWIEFELGDDSDSDASITLVNPTTLDDDVASRSTADVQIANAWSGFIAEYSIARSDLEGYATIDIADYAAVSSSHYRYVYVIPRRITSYPDSSGDYIVSKVHSFEDNEGENPIVATVSNSGGNEIFVEDATATTVTVTVAGVYNEHSGKTLFPNCGAYGILMCAYFEDSGDLISCSETDNDGVAALSVPEGQDVKIRNGCPAEVEDYEKECEDGVDEPQRGRQIIDASVAADTSSDNRYISVTATETSSSEGAHITFTEISSRTFESVFAAGRYNSGGEDDDSVDEFLESFALKLKLLSNGNFAFVLADDGGAKTEGSCDASVAYDSFSLSESNRLVAFGIPPALEFNVSVEMNNADDYTDQQIFAADYLTSLPQITLALDDDEPRVAFMYRNTPIVNLAVQTTSTNDARVDTTGCGLTGNDHIYSVEQTDSSGELNAVEFTFSVHEEYSDEEVEQSGGQLLFVPGTITTEDTISLSPRFKVQDGLLSESTYANYHGLTNADELNGSDDTLDDLSMCSLPSGCHVNNAASNACSDSACTIGSKTFTGTLYQTVVAGVGPPERYEPHIKFFRYSFKPSLTDVPDETAQTVLTTDQVELHFIITGAIPITKNSTIKLPEYIPFLILRDPPGNGSFSTWEKGSSASVSFSLALEDEEGQATNIRYAKGVSFEFETNFGTDIGLPAALVHAAIGTQGEMKGTVGTGYTHSNSRTKGKADSTTVTITTGMAISTSAEYSGEYQDLFVIPALSIRTVTELPIAYDSSTCSGVQQAERSAWEMLDESESVGAALEDYDNAHDAVEDGVETLRTRAELANYVDKAIRDESWNSLTIHTVHDILHVRIPQLQARCYEEWNSLYCNYDRDATKDAIFDTINTKYEMYDDTTGINLCNVENPFSLTKEGGTTLPNDLIDCTAVADIGTPSDDADTSLCKDNTTSCPEGCSGGPSTAFGCRELAIARLTATIQGIIGWRRTLQLNMGLKREASTPIPTMHLLASPLIDRSMSLEGNDNFDNALVDAERWTVNKDKTDQTVGSKDRSSTRSTKLDGIFTDANSVSEFKSKHSKATQFYDENANGKSLGANASIISFSGGANEMTFTHTSASAANIELKLSKVHANNWEIGTNWELESGLFFQFDLGWSFDWNEANESGMNMEAEHETTTSFTFNDITLQSQFDVEVKRDNVYGTPVFKTLAGRSMCPHEKGTDSREVFDLRFSEKNYMDLKGVEGNYKWRTLARGNVADGNAPESSGECVTFFVDVMNQSPFDDGLDFFLELKSPADTDKFGQFDIAGLVLKMQGGSLTMLPGDTGIKLPQSEGSEIRRWDIQICPDERVLEARQEKFDNDGTLDASGNPMSGYVFCNVGLSLRSLCEFEHEVEHGYMKGLEKEEGTEYKMCSEMSVLEEMQRTSEICYEEDIPEILGTSDYQYVWEDNLKANVLIHCLSFDPDQDLCTAGPAPPCATSL